MPVATAVLYVCKYIGRQRMYVRTYKSAVPKIPEFAFRGATSGSNYKLPAFTPQKLQQLPVSFFRRSRTVTLFFVAHICFIKFIFLS